MYVLGISCFHDSSAALLKDRSSSPLLRAFHEEEA